MERIVSVRLRDTGQNFLYNAHDLEVKEGDYVIVEHDRGLDYGQITAMKAEAPQPPAQAERAPGRASAQPQAEGPAHVHTPQPVKKIIRIAKEGDLKQIEDNRARSKEAFNTCQKKIAEHKLDMKLVQAEYSFDRSKIIFYFTSGGRVDFRNLVKDLAKIFKARIELRQIGVRDETKFFGGFGPCGRELCCASFLKDFEPVTIKMAKEEGLPLNPPKISGICGRLMCCLNYEYETYKALAKGLPREGERVNTNEGKGKVINVNVFKRSATVELEDGKMVVVTYGEDQKADYCERPAQGDAPARPLGQRCEKCERAPEKPARAAQEDAAQKPVPAEQRRPDTRNERRPDNRNNGRRPERSDRPSGQRPAQGDAPARPFGQSPAQRPERQDRPDRHGRNDRPPQGDAAPRPFGQRRDRRPNNPPDNNRPRPAS